MHFSLYIFSSNVISVSIVKNVVHLFL